MTDRDQDDADDIVTPLKTKRSAGTAALDEHLRSKKQVSFGDEPKRKAISQKAKMFGDDAAHDEPPVPLAKRARMAAKKNRKLEGRLTRNSVPVDDEPTMAPALGLATSLEARTVALTVADPNIDDEINAPYDFAAFFPAGSKISRTLDESEEEEL